MKHVVMSAKTIRVITVAEADLRESLGLDEGHELTAAIAESEIDGSGKVVLTFARRES